MPERRVELMRRVGLDVSRETHSRLETHQALLEKWNPAINLVSRTTIGSAWTRHLLDSAQLFRFASPESELWVDLGTGGGFPGLVCAILAAELLPECRFVLVESDQRKCAFLQTVIKETGVAAKVENSRIEALNPQSADVITARALASLTDLIEYAEPHLAPGGICIFPKGQNHQAELEATKDHWRFKLTRKPSITDEKGVILALGEIERV